MLCSWSSTFEAIYIYIYISVLTRNCGYCCLRLAFEENHYQISTMHAETLKITRSLNNMLLKIWLKRVCDSVLRSDSSISSQGCLEGHCSSSLLKHCLSIVKPLIMHLVSSSTDLNSAHLSALATSAALKNGITSSTNIPFIYPLKYFVIVPQCSA